MELGDWGGSTEEAVRGRYLDYAKMRAKRPRSSTIAWIVSDHHSQSVCSACGYAGKAHTGRQKMQRRYRYLVPTS